MDNPNITMDEYIRLEEERAQRRGETFNWQTARFGRIEHYCEDEYFTDFEAEFPAIVLGNTNAISSQGTIVREYEAEKEDSEIEFPAIVLNDASTSNTALSYEPTVSLPRKDEIDFRISFDESDDEDYTVIFDKNSFSYKIISVNDLKTDSDNDNKSPNLTGGNFDDLDYYNDVESEFPAIIYNDGLMSKSNLVIEPSKGSQTNDENETSLSKYDIKEQNTLNLNNLLSFCKIYPDNSKSDRVNDDDIMQSSENNLNTKGSYKLLKISHDKISKNFNDLAANEFDLMIPQKYECASDVMDFRTWPGISLETSMMSTMDLDGVTCLTGRFLGLNQKAYMFTYGVTCEDEAKKRNSGTKTKTFEENYYLLLYAVSSKEDTAYQFPLRRITLHLYVVCTAGHQSKIRT
ncbi:hypothetical protein Tco_0867683 [Tanacetum coccineum]